MTYPVPDVRFKDLDHVVGVEAHCVYDKLHGSLELTAVTHDLNHRNCCDLILHKRGLEAPSMPNLLAC